MKCPQCSTEMQAGFTMVDVKKGWLPLLAGFGLNAYQHLWFFSGEQQDEKAMRMASISASGELVLKAAEPRRAFRCGGCKAVFLMGTGRTETL
jgi:hypothetical protein